MSITQAGQLNTTALAVPDVYVQITAPQNLLLNGVPSNVAGIVGTASWGPVNSPVTAGNVSQAQAVFGPAQVRKYDILRLLSLAVLQGANNFRIVRVTDGTETAAGVTAQTSCITYTSKYTGSFGNGITVTLSAGSAANTMKVVVAAPGLIPEVFDNIGAGLAGNALWVAIAAAINSGNSLVRGASQIITASAGAGTAVPTLQTLTLAGGTDGASGVTASTLIGLDTGSRKGMYALRNNGCSVIALADCDDSTTWSVQGAFGQVEGALMIVTGPQGDTITNAVSAKATAGIDNYAIKVMMGDWVYWQDTVNGQNQLVSSQGAVLGIYANLSPEQSGLNKPMQGIIGTQRTSQNQPYSSAELQQLAQAGIDVVTNPAPGGNYFALRIGHNSSSNAVTNTDPYTRLTNYLATTLNAGMGKFVGKLNTPTLRSQAKATLDAFYSALQTQGMIADFQTQCDANNNPQTRTALGYLQVDMQVVYFGIVERLIANLQGGSSVTITRQIVSLA